MRRRWSVVLVLGAMATTLSGCEMSDVDPDAKVSISGELLGADGAPVAGADVVLLTEPTLGDVVFGLPFGLGSLGLLCLAEDPPPPCDTRRRATTGDDGEFSFTVTGRETQGVLGDAARMTLSGAAPPQGREVFGPAVTGAFVVQDEEVRLEPLAAARAGLELSAVDGEARVEWAWRGDALRGAPSAPELVFEQGVRPTWVAPADGTGIDLRILEQPAGTVSVVEQRRADGTVDDITHRSEVLPYVSGAGAPPSRDATCSVVTADGSVPVAPCPVTDGDLAEVVAATLACDDPACAEATGYVVDLGSAVPVELVVVRGCKGACPVEVSTDGASWSLVSEVADAYAVAAHDGAPVRYLRATGDAGVHGLAELSAWHEPPDQERFEVVTAADTTTDVAGDRDGGDDGAGSDVGWPLWLAVGMLVLAAGVVGIAVGRRSRSDA